jgi:sulfite reductase (ferredoxin)
MKADRFEDLSGVRCPLNYAKTKMHLSNMESGQTLEIILDDGPPIRNVPGSVQQEGHMVVCQKKYGDQWKVLIRKA